MSTATIQTVNLLPVYLQTNKNAKFLSSTIDQLIQPPQLEKVNSFIGSKLTPTYNVGDTYIQEISGLRQAYQLEPALITYDSSANITSAVAIDDLANEITISGGDSTNFDRLFRSEVYSFTPPIDLDKLVNYQNYCWMPNGPRVIDIHGETNPATNVVGTSTYSFVGGITSENVTLLNGMLVTFSGSQDALYQNRDFFVEGTGTSIRLVPFDWLSTEELTSFNNAPEYITINRASKDLNPWSRYNRWVSEDVVQISETLNGYATTSTQNALYPIVEFVADLQLYNFGVYDYYDTTAHLTSGTKSVVDLFDTTRTNSAGFNPNTDLIDGVAPQYGDIIVFANSSVSTQNHNAYQVTSSGSSLTITWLPTSYTVGAGISVKSGAKNGGTNWIWAGSQWVYAQQHGPLNSAPLFDLFDSNGYSYTDKNYYISSWGGSKIFGYKIGTGSPNSILGFPLSYQNVNLVGSYLFHNYYANEIIPVTEVGKLNVEIPTKSTYYKIDGNLYNSWGSKVSVPIEKNRGDYYDIPTSLSNNPLNESIVDLTLSDLAQHHYNPTQLVANYNPIAFAMMFIGKIENNVIDAITKSSDAYNQFKFSILTQAASVSSELDTVVALDLILTTINESRTSSSPYYLSDMLGFGSIKNVLTYTVSNALITTYAITSQFDLSAPSTQSILIYINGSQKTFGVDYTFDAVDSLVNISATLTIGDVITVVEYTTTNGCYIPPTPSKLGLYPKFIPSMYVDTTYSTPTTVIRGHDGSITVAYNDYRDAILLEYELRVYNNIKVAYRSELFNIFEIMPGAFRTGDYTQSEINSIIEQDFIRWSGLYNIDYTTNAFDSTNSLTWNYSGSYNGLVGKELQGSWRSIFKYFYDTDQPATCPWEMLGYADKPTGWDSAYGTAPYTSGNSFLWDDLEAGYDRTTGTYNAFYARPGLHSILPVDANGNQLAPDQISTLLASVTPYNIRQNWIIGDQGPAETAWRRSSFWPFVMQRLAALTRPASYSSLMYDPFNMNIDAAGQWSYGTDGSLPQLSILSVHGENGVATTGYSVFISEIGQQRTQNYISNLRQDLTAANFQLFHKVGGFVNRDSLRITIDAYNPASADAGAILPERNYQLILNTSNPIRSTGISGLIIQRVNGKFVVTGYDRKSPYFTYYASIRNANTPTITIGGISSSYVTWAPAASVGDRNLTNADVTTANAAPTTTFYQQGQIVQYGNNYYRVKVSHQAETVFDSSLYSLLSKLPTTGGATVQIASSFDKTPLYAPYGQTYDTIQDVYDLITGYGAWLTDQGFVFNQYSSELDSVVDWNLTASEFLYWSTQSWINNSLISLSPFADELTYQYNDSVVDNIFDSFYEYSIYSSDGSPFPRKNLFVGRNNGQFTINTINTGLGIYYARLNSVQKEHGMVFDNTTMFGDVIFDPATGQRQHRMKLEGFRTANWNGDFFAPGFVYDQAKESNWAPYTEYIASDIVVFNGKYYSAKTNLEGSKVFDFTKWNLLNGKPAGGLIPNFDYKITAFNDFYSLDIDSFDANQQQAAQALTGYIPRPYLNNIFTNPTSQYKFYQGFIREKGTRNPIDKMAKASTQSLNSRIDINEEWAFRVGNYGSFTSFEEYEVPLPETKFVENPQVIGFVNSIPTQFQDLVYYVAPSDLTISTSTNGIPQFITETGESLFKLMYAGYPQLNDVDNTAYDINSLITLADTTALSVGNTVWVGSTGVNEWNVYRYVYVPAAITSVAIEVAYTSIIFTTNESHGLVANDIISVTNIDSSVNGIYQVSSVIGSTQFTVANTASYLSFVFPTTPGMLFKFESARFATYDELPSDRELFQYPLDTKLWVDSDEIGRWAVFQKTINYSSSLVNSVGNTIALASGHGLGYSISNRKGNDIVVVGSPTYSDSHANLGRVTVYDKSSGELRFLLRCAMQSPVVNAEYGYAVIYDDKAFNNTPYGLIFVGAPGATNTAGVVQISSVDATNLQQSPICTITNPGLGTSKFGSSIFVQRNTSSKIVLIGAPGEDGAVYQYIVTATNTVVAGSQSVIQFTLPTQTSANWGYAIVGSDDASIYAISGPGYSADSGMVYTNVSGNILSPFTSGGRFGHAMAMSQDGTRLAISAPKTTNTDGSFGAVAIYTLTNSNFVLEQIITNPVSGSVYGSGMNFGQSIDFDASTNVLVVSSVGTATTTLTVFDQGTTTFDGNTSFFTASEPGSGSVYLYDRRQTRYVYSEELTTSEIEVVPGSNYGTCVTVDNGVVLAGAPAITNGGISSVYKFTQIDTSYNGWNKLRSQPDLVKLDNIEEIKLINTVTEEIVNYYDYHDPLKGKILGVAEQELTYKTSSDPAVYSIGSGSVSVNTNINWTDDHVGELWWDLSTAKFVWYEQGDLEYRRNNWGGLFPGASIDIYEWVESTVLPSIWATTADTTDGLASGISGTPKDVTDSTVSVKQVYDPISGLFNNYYYFWVLNKVVIPATKNRRISAYDVSLIITDPTAADMEYAAVISDNAVMLGNAAPNLVSDNISLNISIDTENKGIPRHVEWVLVEEGSNEMKPPVDLERKMIESMVGQTLSSDNTSQFAGNPVPDPLLSERTRYGISFRPQQTMFKDRLQALRTVVEYANSVLGSLQITGNANFNQLNAQEPPPEGRNVVVEDDTELELVDSVTSLSVAVTTNTSVIYLASVTGINIGDNISASGATIANAGLTVVGVNLIANSVQLSGNLLTPITTGTSITFFPTVTVLIDADSKGGWAVYKNLTGTWTRIKTQSYNTTFYWTYVDWVSPDYDKFKLIMGIVDEVSEITGLQILPGQYGKINNRGDGRYIIVEKVATGTIGNFTNDFNLMYIQGGTIQISDGLWNHTYGWDSQSFDQLGWNQGPSLEIRNILLALRDDIFINDMKTYWNQLFFKGVKYAFTEHSEIDWAFKTSFIKATTYAGTLTQSAVYKLTDSAFYEDYLNEVKPYRTKVRTFTTEYDYLETSNTTITDFDFPSHFNTATGKSEVANVTATDVTSVPVRAVTGSLIFDRISSTSTIGLISKTDLFIGTGNQIQFPLSWLAQTTKINTTATINGQLVLPTDYAIVETLNTTTHQKTSSLLFLNDVVPGSGSIITISYNKSMELMTAVDRIVNYYSPLPGMPGTSLADLIPGIVDPRNVVGGGSFTSTLYDSYINGAGAFPTWSTTSGLVNALGVNPTDIIVDGGTGFISSLTNQAPEEVVPGFTIDTLGIDVYTKDALGAPTIVSGSFSVVASTSTTRTFNLATLPATADNMFVTFGGVEFAFTSTAVTTTSTSNQFSIDWFNHAISIPPQSTNGILAYTILGVGENATTGLGLIDSNTTFTTGTTTTTVVSLASSYDVQNYYVTVNGQSISQTTSSSVYYSINSGVSRASVTVHNLSTATTYAVQTWFFGTAGNIFNQVYEQNLTVHPQLQANAVYTLNPVPPVGSQVIVEYVYGNGNRKRLMPTDPNMPSSYDYTISTGTLTLSWIPSPGIGDTLRVLTITNMDMQVSKFVGNPAGTYTLSAPVMNVNYIWVAVTGTNVAYTLTSGVDYQVLSDGVTVQISNNYSITTSDTVEILSFTDRTYDTSVLAFRQFRDLLGGTAFTRLGKAGSTYLIAPLGAYDTEIHVADTTVLSPPDISSNRPGVILLDGERIEFYTIVGSNIISQLRRATLGTGMVNTYPAGTVVIDQGIYQEIPFNDTVLVQNTFTSATTSTYPIFQTSGPIVTPYSTSTIINDGIVLSADTSIAGKDQIQVFYGSRLLRKDGHYKHDGTVRYNSLTIPSAGFPTTSTVAKLPTPVLPGTAYLVTATNQVWVYAPNTTDLVINKVMATTATLFASTVATGTTVLVTSTNQIYWATGSTSTKYVVTATMGYVDSGIRYYPPEFTVVNTYTSLPLVTLNISPILNNVQVTFVKRQYSTADSWNDIISSTSTKSILSSTNAIATFIQDSPGVLPNSYFYGGR